MADRTITGDRFPARSGITISSGWASHTSLRVASPDTNAEIARWRANTKLREPPALFARTPALPPVIERSRTVASRTTPYRETRVQLMQKWERYTTGGANGALRPNDFVELGPGTPPNVTRRLLGDVKGQRILDLGCGAGQSCVALAKQGARVITIDPDEANIERTRAAADAADVHVETHHGDLADLAFLPPESLDAVVCVHSLSAVADVGRVFRQAHRLLKAERAFVLSLPHPATLLTDAANPTQVVRGYGDTDVLGEGDHLTHPHRTGELFTELVRANYRVDTLIEELGAASPDRLALPTALIMRARRL